MACFITPLVTGIILGLFRRLLKRGEGLRLDLLELMLISGALILMVEHAWRGEIVPHPPFLTAMANTEDSVLVLSNELSIVGGSMVIATTSLWATVTTVSRKLRKTLSTPLPRITTLGTSQG